MDTSIGEIPPHHYSVHQDPAVDARIRSDLEIVMGAFVASGIPAAALVLIGGFGRGEGSVRFGPDGPVPYNDYDLAVIVNHRSDDEGVSTLARSLARRLGFGHVDVLVYTRTELRTVPVSQHLFDIKHGGFVFHGDPAVLDLIPDQPAGELPKTCAWTLVINRLSCLLESVQESFFETPPAGSDLLLMEYMAHKIVLCAAEALLIMRGTYDVSYARRAEAFAREFADRPDAVELVKRSTRFKLLETVADGSDPAGLWFEARDLYLGAVTECARPRLGPRADSWTAIAGLHEGPWLGHWLRRLKWRFLDSRRHQDLLWWRRKARLEMAELFLLVARRAGGGAHEEWLARARDRLAPHAAGPIGSWEEVRRAAIWCERRFVHPVV